MINHFYVTLPSNDGSIKYYPQNTNHSWKNRLSHHIDLEGDREVGLASISLPCESLLQDYLQTLKADDILLWTVRKVYNTLSRFYNIKITIVRYKDIRDKRLVTVHDLLEALFDVERDYFVIALDNTFYINLTNKHYSSMSAWMKRAKRVPSPPRTLKLPPWVWIWWLPSSKSCYTRVCVDCSNGYKMDPPVSDRTPTIQNGNKLTLEKNRQGWHESPFQTTKFPHPLRLVLFPQFQSRRILSPWSDLDIPKHQDMYL